MSTLGKLVCGIIIGILIAITLYQCELGRAMYWQSQREKEQLSFLREPVRTMPSLSIDGDFIITATLDPGLGHLHSIVIDGKIAYTNWEGATDE